VNSSCATNDVNSDKGEVVVQVDPGPPFPSFDPFICFAERDGSVVRNTVAYRVWMPFASFTFEN
jgi:hypothetical protein